MSNYVYILREKQTLESGEVSVYLKGFATEDLAESELIKQVDQKIADAMRNGDGTIFIDDLDGSYAELYDEHGNKWVFSVEPLFIKQA